MWATVGNNSSNPPIVYNYFLYVANQSNTTPLNGYSFNTGTGFLTPITPMPADLTSGFGYNVGSFTLPSQQVEVVVSEIASTDTYGYLVNPLTGLLTEVTHSPLTNTFFMGGVDTANGPFIFSESSGGATLDSYTVNPLTGAFPAAPLTLASGSGPTSYVVQGGYMYVADQTGGDIRTYQINPGTGALTSVSTYLTAAGSGLAVFGDSVTAATHTTKLLTDPQGRFLFDLVLNGAAPDSIYSYVINGDGTLTANGSVAGTDEMGGGGVGVIIDPTGQYLYEGDGTTNSYFINQTTGALTYFGNLPAFGGNMIVDPTNTYLILASGLNLRSYTGMGTGTLTYTGQTYAMGGHADQMLFDPTGQFLLGVGQSSHVWVVGFSSGGGSFTPVAGSPFAAGTDNMTMTFVKIPQ